MAISAKDAIKKYKVELLQELPLDEPLFFAMAERAGLFPLGINKAIKAEKTRACKVDYFLDHVVEPGADKYLPKLLKVMRESKVDNVMKLADDIQVAVGPGDQFNDHCSGGMTISNKELRRDVDVLKIDNTQLRTDNDAKKDEIIQLNNDIAQLRKENQQLKQQLLQKKSITSDDLFIKWEKGEPAPVCRYNHTAVWLNGLVYVGAGFETGYKASCIINCYDSINCSWSSSINTIYGLFAMTTLNNKLVTAGGEDKNQKITNEILMMDADQLKCYIKMKMARSLATATGHQGMLIITGGTDDRGKRLSSTELFDSNNGQWYECSNISQPHSSLKPVIVDNILYLLGGHRGNDDSPAVFTAPLDTLSTHQVKWNTHQKTPSCFTAPVSVNGTHLLIVGGYNNDEYNSDIRKLNKVSHSWEAIGHIPSATSRSAAVSTADNRVIVIGGLNNKGEATDTVWIGSCEPQ